MDSFLMVRSTGAAQNQNVGRWISSELAKATNQWRAQFRGDPRVKDDSAVTDADIAAHNLILWGDPQSNRVLARMADKLPVKWVGQTVRLGGKTFTAEIHVPVCIFPNPLNPKRYVVLNSSVTFRMGSRTSNSLQTPKLPDWALVDLRTPPSDTQPGLIYDAGFFNEQWRPQ